jgi:prophage antirepressor-like protein
MISISRTRMLEEIKTDNNCIIKAFENNPISIIEENVDNKKLYCFKANDIAKVLDILNIRQSIQNYDEDERVVRKVYDPYGTLQDTIFLTSRGVYRLLYNSKKEIAKKFRKWASDILDDIIFNQSKELQRQLQEKDNKLQLLELQNQEKDVKINLMTRKTNKFELGESVYIFHSTFNDDDKQIDLYKVGRTKNANLRDSIHKTASYKGILLQVRCVDCVLLERVVHFLLNKYRCANRREWFNCSYDIVKRCIYYAKALLENEIDLSNPQLLDNTNDFVKSISYNGVNESKSNSEINTTNESIIFTTLEYKACNIDNFDVFLEKYFETDNNSSISHTVVKNQYKIWSKTAKHLQLKKMIDYLKTKYTTTSKRYNPLVSTSKLTPHFNGLKLKELVFEFDKPDNQNLVIEQFLFEKCKKAPGYRITMQDFVQEFEKWYDPNNKLTHLIKEKLKNYLDIMFIRLRSGDESGCTDNRIGGWLGFALKNNNTPEPIKKYKPKNAKVIIQRDVTTNTIVKSWSSVSELSDYIRKSRTVTSTIIKRHEQIIIDNIICVLEYQ